jgi:CheY-like chemotaxis protein
MLVVAIADEGRYPVVAARNGAEALERALEVRPAVVVLDIGLPGVDGGEVARRLKADRGTASCWIIGMSAKYLKVRASIPGSTSTTRSRRTPTRWSSGRSTGSGAASRSPRQSSWRSEDTWLCPPPLATCYRKPDGDTFVMWTPPCFTAQLVLRRLSSVLAGLRCVFHRI